MIDWNRCIWTMPDASNVGAGARCVKESGHGRAHVVAEAGGDSVTFWVVKPRTRRAKQVLHVDLRSGANLDDDECVALYHYLRTGLAA